jgi:hypothetical protein
MSPLRTRREVACLLFQAALALPVSAHAQVAAPGKRDFETSFDFLLGKLSSTSADQSGVRRDQTDRVEEGQALAQRFFIRAFASATRISERATSLIIASEVSGASQYRERFHKPTWPGGSSGVTIGIGYDLGFVNAKEFRSDWGTYIPAADFALLAQC